MFPDRFYNESKITTSERNSLKDSDFGIPNKREYPLTDETHILQAVRMFSHADDSDKPILARNIIKRAKALNMNTTGWNSLDKYITEAAIEYVNDKGEDVPKVCPKCGSEVKLYLHGEPVFLCSNKECKKFFGVLPCNISESFKLNTEDYQHRATAIGYVINAAGTELLITYGRDDDDFYGNEVYNYNFCINNPNLNNKHPWVGHCYIIYNKYKKYSFDEGEYYITPGRWIHDFVIDDRYRNKGIGSVIMNYMINKHQIDHMAVSADNDRAIHVYEKFGFKQYEQRGDIIFMKREATVADNIIEGAINMNFDNMELDEFIQEGSQSRKSKERRNLYKNLEKMDYDKSTKTIKTVDGDGVERRVKFSMGGNNLDQPSHELAEQDHYNDNIVNLSNRTMKSGGNYANAQVEHELGHEWDDNRRQVSDEIFDKEKFIHDEAVLFIKKHIDDLIKHDAQPKELRADVRSAEKCGFNIRINTMKKTVNMYYNLHTMYKDTIQNAINIYNDIIGGAKKEFHYELNQSSFSIDAKKAIADCRKSLKVIQNADKEWSGVFTSEINEAKHELECAIANLEEFYKYKHDPNNGGDNIVSDIKKAKKEIENSKTLTYDQLKRCQETIVKSMNLRIQFLMEMKKKLEKYKVDKSANTSYKHPKKIFKESFEEYLDKEGFIYEYEMVDELSDEMFAYEYIDEFTSLDDMDIDDVIQEGMFDAGFATLRNKLMNALKGKFKFTNITKAVGANQDRFCIYPADDDTNKINVINTGSGVKVPGFFNNVALSHAFDKIMELLESPKTFVTEGDATLSQLLSVIDMRQAEAKRLVMEAYSDIVTKQTIIAESCGYDPDVCKQFDIF